MEDFTGGSYRAAKSFRNQRGISQLRGIFVANGKKMETFSQPISQLRNEGGGLRNGTSVLRGGFAATKPPAKWGCGCENVIFQALGISQSISQLRKFLQKGCMGLRNHFAAKGQFRSGLLGAAKLFRSQGPFSQGPILGCEISQASGIPCF